MTTTARMTLLVLLMPLTDCRGGEGAASSDAAPQNAKVDAGSHDIAVLERSCDEDPDATGIGTWTPLAKSNAPVGSGQAHWTGREVVVMQLSFGTPWMKAYDPTKDAWRDVPNLGWPAARDRAHVGIVDGKVLVYGGSKVRDGKVEWQRDGALIDPATGQATALPSEGAPALDTPKPWAPLVFARGERALLVAGGRAAPHAAAVFDARTRTWVGTVASEDVPASFGCYDAAWNGDEAACSNFGALYRVTLEPLAISRWSPEPPTLDTVDTAAELAWAGKQLVVWSGRLETTEDAVHPTAVWDATSGWRTLATTMAARNMPALAAIGERVVLWGGLKATMSSPPHRRDGAVLDPASGTWSLLSCQNAPNAGTMLSNVVSAGDSLYVIAGQNSVRLRL